MAEIIGRVGWRNYVSPISPLWNNLVAYWSGDNTANDAKGTYNGTLINGATYSTGKISNGFSFDGVNDYVNISPSLGSTFSKPSSAHSYSAWIYPTSLAGYNWIIQNGTSTTGTSMILNGANLCFFIQGGQDQTTSSATLTINTWAMVTVVYNGAGAVSFYKNGVLINSSGASWGESVATSNTYIGAINGGVHFFDGKIDEVGAWSRALTATEVAELYNAGAGKQYVAPAEASIVSSGLIMNLDAKNVLSYSGTGTTWTDLSGNGNNGTLVNGTSYSSANGGTMLLDGINDYVSVTGINRTSLVSTFTFTLSLWYNKETTPNGGIFEISDTPNSESPFILLQQNSASLSWYLTNGYRITVPVSINTWNNVVLTYSSNQYKTYINGVLSGSYSGGLSGNSGSLIIGTGYPTVSKEKVSAFHVYNRDLSATEVTANFNALKGRYGL